LEDRRIGSFMGRRFVPMIGTVIDDLLQFTVSRTPSFGAGPVSDSCPSTGVFLLVKASQRAEKLLWITPGPAAAVGLKLKSTMPIDSLQHGTPARAAGGEIRKRSRRPGADLFRLHPGGGD